MVTNLNLPQQAINAIYAGMIVIISLTTIACYRQWQNDWVLTHTAPPATNSLDNKNIHLIASIPNNHLFGKSASGKIPLSSLELRLTGIVKVEDDNGNSLSKAYISQAGQAAKIYQVGDKIIEGVKVYSITSDTVILDNGGELERLPFPREPLVFKPRDDTERM